MTRDRSPLPFYLASAYTLLAVYGSLYPFADWNDSGAPLLDFLSADWPRYITTFDIVTNMAAYLPMGFLWTAALRRHLPALLALLLAILLGSGLSLGIEVLQHFLPSRVPSNVDLACNAAGTLVGALLGARWGRTMFDGGRLDALRRQLFVAGSMPDAGLLLIWLWLLTQLNPDTLLFGNGSLRYLLGIPSPLDYTAGAFARVEAAIVGTHTLAAALIVTLLARPLRARVVLAVLGAGLLAKSFAFMVIMRGSGGFAWATPGSISGLILALLIWLFALPLRPRWQRALAALSLLVATVLVNIAPDNPYLAHTYQAWNPGQFLNFHGLTRLASNLWPFLALPWLMLMKADHEA